METEEFSFFNVKDKDGNVLRAGEVVDAAARERITTLETNGGGGTGTAGADGVTYTPSVSAEGVLSWTNDGGLENPDPVNIMGPQGETGPQGVQGDTGAAGAKGDTGPQGPQGEQGEKGETGPAGYTPVRGTDYWTDEDKAEIKAYVDEAILGGAW